MGTTSNYGWEYPDDGGDADTWGAILTTLFQAIDTSLKSVFDTLTTLITNAAPVAAVQDFLRTSAPTGWIVLNGTIGNTSSGATYANSAAQNLFNVLWAQFDDATLPMLTSTGGASSRGVSASADWSANKRLTLPSQSGRFRRSYGGNSAAIGVAQDQDIQPHTHQLGSNDSGTNDAGGSGQEFIRSYGFGNGPAATSSQVGTTETRPVNVAYLTCIKL